MKEKRKGVLLIVFGGILAAIVGGLTYMLASQTENVNAPTEVVVVAAQEIGERTVIPANAVTTKKMPVDVVPATALKKPNEAVGRMSLSKIQAGELILYNKLADTKGQSGVSFTLDRGKVVVTFPASNVVGLGLVRVGDTVDLLVTYKPSGSKTAPQAQTAVDPTLSNVTQTTMQNLRVLTIGPVPQPAGEQQNQTNQTNQANQANANFVSFAVEPQDALFLKSIKDAETLVVEMALRSAADDEIHKTEPVTIQDVLSRYEIGTPGSQPASRR